tara:strand:- start:1861 stop:3408 length:1548 start_codon:yes stop_codon:yes gene_type:complete
MSKLSVRQIIKRHELAQRRKDNWRQIYEDCYEFALPQRNLYDGYYEGGGSPGQNKMARVFDSTAINATQRFANRIQAGLFPPYGSWCRLEPGPDIPADREVEAQAILDAYSEKMFSVLRQSNFDLAMGEFLLDLSVGTAVMLIQPGDELTPIRFTAVPQYLVCIEEGANGKVDNVYRRMRLKAEALTQHWTDAELNDRLQRIVDEKPTEEVELVEATIYDAESGEYCYHVLWPEGEYELLKRYMKSSPWIVARYTKVAGEVYGRGPLVTAIPDIKTLNKTLELLLKNASLSIAGVYTAADDGVLNPQTIRIAPGSVIPVARNGGPQGESLRMLPRSGDFNVSQIVINDLRMNIKKIMLDDTLPPDNMSARSATEVAERMKELAQNLGSAFGRLITETMVPMVARILYVMDERGLIEMPLKVNGLEVKVSPVSPIAQAQNLGDIEKIMNWVQLSAGLGPEGQMSVRTGSISDYVADKLGIPAELRTTDAERQQMMEQAQQAAMMAAQAQGVVPEGE